MGFNSAFKGLSTDVATLSVKCRTSLSLRHCISLLDVRQTGETTAGKAEDAMSSQIKKKNLLHFSALQVGAFYTCVLLVTETLCVQCKVLLMCNAVSGFMAKPQKG